MKKLYFKEPVTLGLIMLTSVFGMTFTSSVHAASNAFCRGYANKAAAQHHENIRKNCGFAGLRWTDNKEAAYIFCKAAGSGASNSETSQRANMLKQCKSANGGGNNGGGNNGGGNQGGNCKPRVARDGVGDTPNEARQEAKETWKFVVNRDYGNAYSKWNKAKNKGGSCQNQNNQVKCTVSAKPCK